MSGSARFEETHAWSVGPSEGGQRLDSFLATALGVSRADVRRVLARGLVSWRGRPARLQAKGATVTEGDRIEVAAFQDPARARPLSQPELPLGVLARGEGWLAVDKPAGTPVHPLAPEERGTLLNALIAREPEVFGVGEAGLRSGVVHRLDVHTSGVLLFATREPAWQRLRSAFRRHRVAKEYHALVVGRLEGEGELELRLAVTRHRPARVRVVDAKETGRGRATRLRWRALSPGEAASLVEVRPETGFLHQIRASLAHLGHPVLGDLAYGAPPHPLAPRQLLHARSLRWREVAATCEPPGDFVRAQEALLG